MHSPTATYIVLPSEVLSAEIKIAQSRQNETEREREEKLKRQSKIKSDAHPWLTHASWEMPGENSHTWWLSSPDLDLVSGDVLFQAASLSSSESKEPASFFLSVSHSRYKDKIKSRWMITKSVWLGMRGMDGERGLAPSTQVCLRSEAAHSLTR